MPLDVEQARAKWRRCSTAIRDEWGRLDFAIHSIAFAPREDLHGRVVDCSQRGLPAAQCRCPAIPSSNGAPRRAADDRGGTLITMSYYGADEVVSNYNVMGPVKAALETRVRYLAKELGPRRIRVFAVSPGPMRTRAASGIAHFDELIDMAVRALAAASAWSTSRSRRVVRLPRRPGFLRHDRRRGPHRRRPAQHGLTVRKQT